MSDNAFDVAVVGGGPAGSAFARRVVATGARVVLFDHTHPREKVCGGGISARARDRFPGLNNLAAQGRSGNRLKLVGPNGRETFVRGNGRTFAIDREVLDRALLDEAVAAGVEWRPEKVLELAAEDDAVVLRTGDRRYRVPFVVGADGVFSLVRRTFVGPIPPEHQALGAHVLVDDLNPPCAALWFFGDRRGYGWVFNRKSRSSIGVGMPQTGKHGWADLLARLFAREAPGRPLPRVAGWALPQASAPDAFAPPTAGKNWLLLGDAAGHADPLTGEGILYALWGAQLAADAFTAGRPENYDGLWREAFLPHFELQIARARWLSKKTRLDMLLALGRVPILGARLFNAIGGR